MAKRAKAAENGSFTRIPNAILLARGLNPSERAILVSILYRAWGPGGECFESAKEIGARVGIGKSQASKWLKSLCDKGFLERRPRRGRSKGLCYVVPEKWWNADGIAGSEASGNPESPVRKSGILSPEIRTERSGNPDQKKTPELDSLKQSSSSSSTLGSLDTQNQDIGDSLEIGLAMFGGPSVETNIRKAAETYGADQVRLALLEARAVKDSGKPVKWAYVLGILKNWEKEGGPTPIAQTAVRPSREELQRRKTAENRKAEQRRLQVEMHRQDVEAVRQYRERPESYEGNVRDMQSLVRSMTRLGINESDRQAFERATAKLAELQTAEEERKARESELRTKEHKETLAAYDSDREAYWNDRSKLNRVWDAMTALGVGDRPTVHKRLSELAWKLRTMPATNNRPSRGPVPLTETMGELSKRLGIGGEPASVASEGKTGD